MNLEEEGKHTCNFYHTISSAWAAGYIDMMLEKGQDFAYLSSAARRADILAALCQETVGDHSVVTRSQLKEAEAKNEGKAAHIDVTSSNLQVQRIRYTRGCLYTRYGRHATQHAEMVGTGQGGSHIESYQFCGGH